MADEHERLLKQLKSIRIFSGLTDDQIELLARDVQVVNFDENQLLPLDNQKDYPLCAIAEGIVRLTYPRGNKEPTSYLRKKGDFFGADILLLGKRKLYEVSAEQALILLQYEPEAFQRLVEEIPILKTNLLQAIGSQRHLEKRRFDWLNEDENIQLIAREYLGYLILSLVLPLLIIIGGFFSMWLNTRSTNPMVSLVFLILGVIAILAGIAWGIWNIIDWENDYFIVTDQRVVWLERVVGLYDSLQETLLEEIKAEQIEKDFFGILLGYGNIKIQALGGILTFRRVGNPERIKDIIDIQRQLTQEREKEAGSEALERRVRQIFLPPVVESVQKPPAQEEAPVKEVPNPPSLRESLTRRFQMRIEEGDSITFRKHIIILFKKTFLPLVGLVSFIAALIALQFIANFPFRIYIDLALLLLILISFITLWYQYLDWENDIYKVTSTQIVDSYKRPLTEEVTKVAPIENILSIEIARQGFLRVLLNYGDVLINVGTEGKFTFEYVANPGRVQRDVYHKVHLFRKRRKEAAAAQDRERIAVLLEVYHRQQSEQSGTGNSPEKEVKSG